MMTLHQCLLVISLTLTTSLGWAQGSSTTSQPTASANTPEAPAQNKTGKQKVVIITGARFAYPLVQKWIDDYNIANQDVQLVIEARGSSDPAQYDILIEAYEPSEELKKNREFVYIARYAIVPVANSQSAFAKEFTEKGLDKDLIKQIFFHDPFADKENEKDIKVPYTVYTRLQKAGAPITFTGYFGFQQKDIKGKAIAGSDEHLLKAVLRDSTGITYFPLTVAYDHATGKPHTGLSVIPVDLNGNKRVSADEKIFNNLSAVIKLLEEKSSKEINNIPVGSLHLSVDKKRASAEALAFLRWVILNGQTELHTFGYLKSEVGQLDVEKFEQLNPK